MWRRRELRISAGVLGCLVVILIVGLSSGCSKPPKPTPDRPRVPTMPAAASKPKSEEHAFGDEMIEGDAAISVTFKTDAGSSDLLVQVRNKSPNKVLRWDFWKFEAVEDEHGNTYNKHWLPDQFDRKIVAITAEGNYYSLPAVLRVDPNKEIAISLIYESVPPTSQKAKVTATSPSGKGYVFQGPIKREGKR